MENEENVLGFMELTNLNSIEEAQRYLTAAGNNLELAIQNYYDANQSFFPQEFQEPEVPVNFAQQNIEPEEEEVRPALPREYSQIVEEESIRHVQLNRVKRQFSSSFRDLKKETEIQENLASGIASKKKCIEDLYRNPIDITFNLDLPTAKLVGQKQGKWIILLINDESFQSFCFNRDIFNTDDRIKSIIKKNFILLRKNSGCDESLRIMRNYNLIDHTIPIFLVIDSLTGELKKNFGDTKNVTFKEIKKELKKYSTSSENQLQYNSDAAVDSDEDESFPSLQFPSYSSSSSSSSNKKVTFTSTSSSKPQTQTKPLKEDSDSEESFASLNSDDVNSDNEEAKVLDSDDELLNNETETQTNIMLKLQDSSLNFKYPSKRTVRHLINYIYRNYLVQTGIYDDPRKRFVLLSKVHNKCITSLDQSLNLEESNIHPSCVLLHNTIGKE